MVVVVTLPTVSVLTESHSLYFSVIPGHNFASGLILIEESHIWKFINDLGKLNGGPRTCNIFPGINIVLPLRIISDIGPFKDQ